MPSFLEMLLGGGQGPAWQNPPTPGPAWTDPRAPWQEPPGQPGVGDLPIMALLQSLQQTPPTGPAVPAVQPGSPFPGPFIDLRADRPPPQPMASFDLPGAVASGPSVFQRLLSGNLGEFGAPTTPLAMPAGSAGEAAQKAVGDFVRSLGTGSYAGNIRVGPEAPAPIPKPEGTPPEGAKWGLPPAPSTAMRTMTIGSNGQVVPAAGTAPANPIDSYLPKMIGSESGGKMVPNAEGASSAFGPAQFTDGTWLDTVRTADPAKWAELGGDEGKILSLRKDPQYHMAMARAFTEQNAAILGKENLPVNDASLYAMHFFGQKGGPAVLKAAPGTPLADVVPASTISANPHLKDMTAGQAVQWAGNTIGRQSAGGLPRPRDMVSPTLPIPGQTIPQEGLDPKAFDKFNALNVTRPAPMSTADRLTGVLGGMAAGGANAKDLGSLMMGAGAGAGQAAMQNIKVERGEQKEFGEKSDALAKLLAEIEVRKGEAAQKGRNYGIEAKNEDSRLLNQVATKQAELNAAIQNKNIDALNDFEMKSFLNYEPVVKASKDGISVVKKNPDGTTTISTQPLNSFSAQADAMKEAIEAAAGDKKSPVVQTMLYQGLAQKGEAFVRAQAARDLVNEGHLQAVVGDNKFKEWTKEAEKGLDQGLRGRPEWDTQLKNKLYEKFWSERPPDDIWLPYMLKRGNPGAIMLAPRAKTS